VIGGPPDVGGKGNGVGMKDETFFYGLVAIHYLFVLVPYGE
jgi:hypothetical protein